LTTFDDDELVFDGLRAGAVGYLLKDAPSEKLAEAIRVASSGETFLQPSVAAKVVVEFSRLSRKTAAYSNSIIEALSERELEILRLIAKGESNKEIAGKLFLAEGTVKNHITNILGKLDARDRTQAAIRAKDSGLI
jgi:DNA-binding NarL/FixJ family response regulator